MKKTVMSKVLSVVLTLAMVIACFPALPVFAAGNTLTVDKTATADGVTIFNTIAEAVTAAADGDTIEIAAGTYDEPMEILGKTNLTIVGAGADQVFVTGTDGDSGWGSWGMYSTLAVGGNSANVDISGITFDYSGAGAVAYGSTAIIMGGSSNVTVHNCTLTGGATCGGVVQLSATNNHITFDSNLITGDATTGFALMWGTSDIAADAHDTIFTNNIVTNAVGFDFSRDVFWQGTSYNVVCHTDIVNNTILGTIINNGNNGDGGTNNDYVLDTVIANNIVSSISLYTGASQNDYTGTTITNNAYTGSASTYDAKAVTVDTADIFTDAVAGDYTVVKGSAVVGAADNTTYPVAKDFAGTDRVNNTIGAFEGEVGVVAPSLKLDKTSYTVGDDINVTYTGSASTADWVAINAKGVVPAQNVAQKWAYFNGTSDYPDAVVADGTFSVTKANDGQTAIGTDLPAGDYTIYYCTNDTYTSIASVDFTVEEAAPTSKVYTVDAKATSSGNTFKTIAELPTLNPGDTVNIKAGTYESALAFTSVGSADSSAITIKGEGGVILEGALPLSIDNSYNLDISGITFQSTDTNGDAATMIIKDATNVNLYNCEIANAAGDGIHVVGTWTNCKFYNNYFNAYAKNITGSSSAITGCEFYNNVVDGWAGFATWFVDINNSKFYNNTFNQTATDGGQGVDLNGNAKGNIIKNNIMFKVWVQLPADNVCDYNCYTWDGAEAAYTAFGGAHSIYAIDPMLDDNYKPTATSPVVTAGDAADRLSATDKAGVTWASEMGAFAYVAPVVIPLPSYALSNATISASSAVGAAVGTFSATDGVEGTDYTYALTAGGDNFALSADGALTTKVALAAGTYTVSVTISDGITTSTAKDFTITVTAAPAPLPSFTLSNATISASSESGAAVGTFSATDGVEGTDYTYALMAGTDNFALSTDGALTTKATLAAGTYTVSVTISDGITTSEEADFTITVTAAPVPLPSFTLSKSSVYASSAAGTAVGTFSATDGVEGTTYTYALTAGGDKFALTTAGALTTKAALAAGTYTVSVTISDGKATSTATDFTITATTAALPTFTLSNKSIKENSVIGATIGTFSATNPVNGITYTYSLPSGKEDNASFTLSGTTLKASKSFNYESDASYTIEVAISDGTQTSTSKFTITIINVDESTSNTGGGSNSGGGTTTPTTTTTTSSGLGISMGGGAGSETGTSTFSDIASHWAKSAIEDVAAAGIISGYGDGTVKPQNNASRAEFTTMIVRLLNLKGMATSDFTDVNTDAWYAEAISVAVANGLVNGQGSGKFSPNATITREEAMVMAYNALVKLNVLDEADASALSKYADNGSVSSWAKDAAAILVKTGIISGSDGKLNPKANITRAEICVIIEKIMANYMS